ncbi:MAG: PQQ-dependent sugar dehydrogenase [Flavobacteriales bacterium]|nr:PQQ-dependent sugar dehydrogenase [Flavobacteriales bacterium]
MSVHQKILAIICVLWTSLNLNAQITLDSTILDSSTLITGLDVPWEITWGPDDYIWCTERYGRVSRIDPATGQQFVIEDLSNVVYEVGEAGLLGLVLHPDFANQPYVYLGYVYDTPSDIFVRVSRFAYSNNNLSNETVLIDSVKGASTHDGLRMKFLSDTTLLITTGDAQDQNGSQDLNKLTGKILRIHDDGSIPNDNPFSNSPIWTSGHRNPQGLYIASNGIVYSAEHGPQTDDELNILEKGRNYGWPNVHGYCDNPNETQFCSDSNVYEPIAAFTPTVAASDIVVYEHNLIPEFHNSVLLTVLKDKRVKKLVLDNTGMTVTNQVDYFTNFWGRLRDICVSPDGRVFLATNGPSWTNTDPFTHSIIELKPQGFTTSLAEEHKTSIELIRTNDRYVVQHNLKQSIIRMYTISGQIVDGQISGNSISTEGLDKGLYLLSIESPELNKAQIFKIVVI